MEDNIPAMFLCPISDEIMQDPVLDPTSGITYDRVNIVSWINDCIKKGQEPTSPQSRKRLTEAMLIPNRLVKDAIDDYSNKMVVPAPALANDLLDIKAIKGDNMTLVTIKAPQEQIRVPANICCVIDTSGSMNNEADIKQNGAEKSKFGFSLLDIVKHAVLTVIEGLGVDDYFSLITFSTYAEICLTPTKMTLAGKQLVKERLNKLTPDGSTNLWDGLIKAFGMLNSTPLANSHILLLTDGEPNIEPPSGNGYLKSLQIYKQQFGYPAAVHTFGFGYTLDSALLNDISKECNGSFAFIPDASFVGTIFINLVSNILTTVANRVMVSVHGAPKVDYSLVPFKHHITNDQLVVDLGSITQEQDQYIMLPVSLDELNISVDYYSLGVKRQYASKITVESSDDPIVVIQRLRLDLVNKLLEAYNYCNINDYDSAKSVLTSFISSAANSDDAYVKALLQDCQGQVMEAIDQKYFARWGRHYLLSLSNAHTKMLCNNFKDPGVQYYGGKQFRKLQNTISILFDQLPPPKPSHINAAHYKPVSSMRSFNDSNAPCFHPNSLVTLSTGEQIPITALKKGDCVLSDCGVIATVACIIKYQSTAATLAFSKLDDLLITPWHPIRVKGEFIFPNKVATTINLPCDVVYNVVLESGHILVVNEIECVTMGHSFREGDAQHPYFGSTAIVEDLRQFSGWDVGLIELKATNIHRNVESGLVERFC